ncbi:MAG: efflux RND transporter periplasmic adaptor subunit [Brotaphodocola sp.]
MDKKKKILIGAAVLVLAAGVLVLVKGGSKQTGGMGGPGGMQGGPGGMAQASATVVRAAEPTTGNLSLSTGLTGTVEAADVVYIYAKASGDVTAVYVKAGDMVEQGQVLCEIDTEQVESAKNQMDSAKLKYDEAQSTLNRMQILYNGGDLSEQEYEQYTNAVQSARLSYESAKLSYDKQVEYSTITAPINGRIETFDVDVYDRVSQSTQLCVLAGEGQSRLTFYVTQRMMKEMQVGDAMEIIANGNSYEGTISEISSMVDAQTGLFKVKAEMPASDEIAIGSTVTLNVVTERVENAMLVPVNAIYYSGGDGFVYLYEDGVARMVPVEVGLYDSDYAEIISGLSKDDIVVSTWSSNLYEGAKIRLYEDAVAEDAGGSNGKQSSDGQGRRNGEQSSDSQSESNGQQPPAGGKAPQ